MTPADRKTLREAGPFHVTMSWYYGVRCFILHPYPSSKALAPDLAEAIGRVLNEIARPEKKKGRRQ